MFEKYEAKNKAASPSPSLVAADPEEQIEEQEDVAAAGSEEQIDEHEGLQSATKILGCC